MKAYRICVVAACPIPFPRGTPIRVTRLSEALARVGHEVHVVTYGAQSGELDPRLHVHRISEIRGINVADPGPTVGKLAVLDPMLFLRLRAVLRRVEFDLVHAHHYEGLLVARSATPRRTPVLYDAHTLLERELPSYGRWLPSGMKRILGRGLDRRLPCRADFVVAVSDILRDHLVSVGGVSEDRIGVVGNGVELSNRPAPEPPANPGPEGGIVAYAGNLSAYQGVEFLLRGFRVVLDRRPRALLRILTDSSFTRFEMLSRELGIRDRIEIRPVPPEALHAELTRAHVTVNPRPHCDGMPQKNLNYMAAATPLVAFESSSHPCRHGETCIAVAQVSGRHLGRALLDLLDRPDERLRLGRAARVALEREYTWPNRALQVSEIYERVLELEGDPVPSGTGPS